MEATCILTSKSLNKAASLPPLLQKKRLVLHKASVTCNIRQVPSDEDDEQQLVNIKSDWRSFRARLVAGEQATRSSQAAPPLGPTVLGRKWAHPIHEPETGCLLVATDKLDGVHIFERTVILVLSTGGPSGPTGIILNRPSLMSIKEARSTGFDAAGVFSDRPLFFGGPLEEGLFLVGPNHRGGGGGGGGGGVVLEEVMEGWLYYGVVGGRRRRRSEEESAAEMAGVGGDFIRFYDGYCGWAGEEQLREEIRDGFWKVVACSRSVVGLATAGPVGLLWEEVLGLLGERNVW